MITNYFQKNRDKHFPLLEGQWDTKEFKEKILPKLKSMNVNDMSNQMWFFFHPSAYSLMYWGTNWVIVIALMLPFIYSVLNQRLIMSLVLGSIILIQVWNFAGRYKNRKIFPPKGYTFYDNWLKKDEEV